MPEQSRIQVRIDDTENTWKDVGYGPDNTPVPVSGSFSVEEPLPTEGNNPATLLSFNASGDLVYVDETIGATTYRQTFTRSDMVVDSTLAISEFEEL